MTYMPPEQLALGPSQVLTVRDAKSRHDLKSRDLLRAATVGAHDRVDRLFSQFDLASHRDYRLFLEAHQAVLPGCERALTASSVESLLPDWPVRRRASALAADLRDLGWREAEKELSVPVLDRAQAMGLLYVLEGSRLGGAVLARRVGANGDARCRVATRYLRHGEGTRLWPSFVAVFNNSELVRDALPEVIDAARQSFFLFEAAAEAVLARSASRIDH